jgi:hypothetical protein
VLKRPAAAHPDWHGRRSVRVDRSALLLSKLRQAHLSWLFMMNWAGDATARLFSCLQRSLVGLPAGKTIASDPNRCCSSDTARRYSPLPASWKPGPGGQLALESGERSNNSNSNNNWMLSSKCSIRAIPRVGAPQPTSLPLCRSAFGLCGRRRGYVALSTRDLFKGGGDCAAQIRGNRHQGAALDAPTKHGPLILTNSLRRPWTSHGFQASWHIAARNAGIIGVTFHDLRGPPSRALRWSDAPRPRLPLLPGTACATCNQILDANYLHRDPALAESAIKKLETGRPGVVQ